MKIESHITRSGEMVIRATYRVAHQHETIASITVEEPSPQYVAMALRRLADVLEAPTQDQRSQAKWSLT